MKTKAILIGALLGMLSHQAVSDKSDSFDVPSGSFRTLASGVLAPNTVITCEFSIDEAYFGTEWLPSVNLIFGSIEEADEASPTIKLSASRANMDEDWRHQLSIATSSDRESVITAHTGFTESVLPMQMFLTDDQFVIFYVGEELDNFSAIDVAGYSLTKWSANASGVRGNGDCDSFLLDESAAE